MNNIVRGGPEYGYSNGHPGSDVRGITVARSNSLRQHTPPQHRRAPPHNIPSPLTEYPEHPQRSPAGYQPHPGRSPGNMHPGQQYPGHPGQQQPPHPGQQHPGYNGYNDRDQSSMAGTLPRSISDTLTRGGGGGGQEPNMYNGYNNQPQHPQYGGRQMSHDGVVDGYGTIERERNNAYPPGQHPGNHPGGQHPGQHPNQQAQSPTGGRYPAYPMGNSSPNVQGPNSHMHPGPNRPNQHPNRPPSASNGNGTLPRHEPPSSMQHDPRNGGPYHDPRNGGPPQHGGPQYGGPQHGGPPSEQDPYDMQLSPQQQYDRVS